MSDETSVQLRRHKGIFLLPNLFTTASLFSGFYAIIAAENGRFETAAVAIYIAMVLDGLDGRVARLTHTESDFGAEYDSLADMVAFGLAPALIMYDWALKGMAEFGWVPAKLGWLAAFLYAAATALRLARFNTQIGSTDKRYFVGLACPSAAAIMMGLVWVVQDVGGSGADVAWLAWLITISTAVLMVSNILFYSFKTIDLKGKVPFVAVLAIVLGFVFASIDPPKVLFFLFIVYGLSGPFMALIRHRQRSRRRDPIAPKSTPGDDTR